MFNKLGNVRNPNENYGVPQWTDRGDLLPIEQPPMYFPVPLPDGTMIGNLPQILATIQQQVQPTVNTPPIATVQNCACLTGTPYIMSDGNCGCKNLDDTVQPTKPPITVRDGNGHIIKYGVPDNPTHTEKGVTDLIKENLVPIGLAIVIGALIFKGGK